MGCLAALWLWFCIRCVHNAMLTCCRVCLSQDPHSLRVPAGLHAAQCGPPSHPASGGLRHRVLTLHRLHGCSLRTVRQCCNRCGRRSLRAVPVRCLSCRNRLRSYRRLRLRHAAATGHRCTGVCSRSCGLRSIPAPAASS